jgi:Terminase large subunit, T4likevirus-type, N-terminal
MVPPEQLKARKVALLEEVRRRRLLYTGLFEQQAKVLADTSRYIAICCSRRAGKTYLLARLIVRSLWRSRRNEWVVFCARTLAVAKATVWSELMLLIKELALDWKVSESEGWIATDTGAMFRLVGVNDTKSIEKVRGNKYRLVILDEASTYQEYLKGLISQSFSPGLVDIEGSQLILSGTPGYVCTGYWFDACHKPGYSRHYWTLRENPSLTDVDAFLAEMREKNHWTIDDPVYVREYLGKWVNDSSSRVFAYHETKDGQPWNRIEVLPEKRPFKAGKWLVTLGIDYGYTDSSAWVVLGSHPHHREIYVLHAEKHAQLLPDECAKITAKLRKEYQPTKIVGDGGGTGKTYIMEWNRRYAAEQGAVIHPADKADLIGQINLINGSLRSGLTKLVGDGATPLANEISVLPWLNAAKNKVHPSYEDHCADAFRYAWMVHHAYNHVAPDPPGFEVNEDAYKRWEERTRKASDDDWMY